MAFDLLSVEHQAKGVARVTLNRPELRNAFNEDLIAEITAAITQLGRDDGVRVIILTGAGAAFSAGADLSMMRRIADASPEENLAEARRLAAMMHALDTCAKPTVALVNGPAIGGGVGLVAACDIVIASQDAFFALPEARLGLAAAVISPFVTRAIGARQARRYVLTGERFDAATAHRLGLVHETAPATGLNTACDAMVHNLLACGPEAQAACKELIAAIAGRSIDDTLMEETAQAIAAIRAGAEGKEGVSAFLDKRAPAWTAET